jgi:hypothetical protein
VTWSIRGWISVSIVQAVMSGPEVKVLRGASGRNQNRPSWGEEYHCDLGRLVVFSLLDVADGQDFVRLINRHVRVPRLL